VREADLKGEKHTLKGKVTIMAKTTKAAEATNQAFAAAREKFATLPKGEPGAYIGKEPNADASPAQVRKIEALSVAVNGDDAAKKDNVATKLDAHAVMNAYKEVYPDKYAAVDARFAAEKAAAKAAEPKPAKAASAAYKGTDPDAPASDSQKILLEKLGKDKESLAGLTKSGAHDAINAEKTADPAKFAAVQAESKAAEQQKAREILVEMAKNPSKANDPARQPYTCNKNIRDTAASYEQLVQLSRVTGKDGEPLRSLDDKSTRPTKGEVANQMNAARTADPEKYAKEYHAANRQIQSMKHGAPTPQQFGLAQRLKCPELSATASTTFSVSEKIHVALETQYAEKAAKAVEKAAAPARPSLEERVAATANRVQASSAAKTAPTSALQTPAATKQAQSEAQAGA
jgi:hypothetical protein